MRKDTQKTTREKELQNQELLNEETQVHELDDEDLDQVAGGFMVVQMAPQSGTQRHDVSQATTSNRSDATPINVPFR